MKATTRSLFISPPSAAIFTIVELLIEHGADPIGAGTVHQLDVLGWAVCFDYAMRVEVARYLLAHHSERHHAALVATGR